MEIGGGSTEGGNIKTLQSYSHALGSQNLLPNLALPTWPQALWG